MSLKNQIIKNVCSNYAMSFIQMGLGLILVPFLIAKLGSDAFGLIVLAESSILLFEIVSTSVRIALSRYVTIALAKDQKDDFNSYLASGLLVSLVSFVIIVIVGCTVSAYFPSIFTVPESLVSQSKWLYFLITMSLAIVVPNIIFWSILYAKQRFDMINISMSSGVIFRGVSLFALFSFLPEKYVTLPIYGLVYMLTTLIQNAMVIRFQRQLMPDLKIRLKNASMIKIKEILAFCADSSLTSVTYVLYDTVAAILVNIFWGPAANAIYAVGLRIPMVLNRFFVDSTWALTPTFTDLVARDEKKKVEFMFFFYSKMMGLLTMPLLAGLVVFGPALIYFWVGSEFHDAIIIMIVSFAAQFFTIPFAICGCLLNAYGKIRIPSRVGVLVAILNVIVAILLGKVFNWGLVGIATAALISKASFNALFILFYTSRVTGLDARRFAYDSFLKPLCLAVIVMSIPAVIIYTKGTQYDLSFVNMLMLAMAGLSAYLIGYLFICNKSEKAAINTMFWQAFEKLVKSKKQAKAIQTDDIGKLNVAE